MSSCIGNIPLRNGQIVFKLINMKIKLKQEEKIAFWMSIVLVGILFMCGGCGIREGTVIAKKYEPANVIHTMHCYPMVIGKMTIMQCYPVTIYDDEDWLIEIEGYNQKHQLKDRWIYIEKEMYDTIKTGDYYCIDNKCHVNDNNNIERRDE